MARSVLASEMLTRLREATNTENDTHLTTAELYRMLTSAVSDTWDQLLSSGIGTEGVKSVTFTSVANQTEYVLATLAPDFFQVSQLYTLDPEGRQRPVGRVQPAEHWDLKAPRQAASMKLYYFPAAPTFITGSETFDGINGWEEHTIQTAAIAVMTKKQDDTGQFRARKRELELRMKSMANRLQDAPPRVVRRSQNLRRDYFIPYQSTVRGYDLRGANLELYA